MASPSSANIPLERISVLAELERISWQYEPAGGDEVKCLCPAHLDSTPSCTINLRKRLWKCHAAQCQASGDIITFIANALKKPRTEVWAELCDRLAITSEKTIDLEVVEKAHAAIWEAGPLLAELHKRGLTDDMIRRHRLGFSNGRITIPVFTKTGACLNIRKYLPGAPTADKFKNVKGHGESVLYPRWPHDQLEYDKIIVVGGECKAIVTAAHMNALGFGSICLTTGEGKDWNDSHIRQFKGKTVYVCMDIDKGGMAATTTVCATLRGVVAKVYEVMLPLDRAQFPKGDPNDYFGVLKKTGKDFLAVLLKAPEFTGKALPAGVNIDMGPSIDLTEPPVRVHLSEATSAKFAGKRVVFKAQVTAMDETPYLVPKLVRLTCERNQKFCTSCPVFAKAPDENGSVALEISTESPALMNMVKAPKKEQKGSVREALRMPACKHVNIRVLEYHNVEDLRIVPQLDIASRAADHVINPCLFVGKGLELNAGYDFECRVFPNPKSQQALLLAYKATPSEDSLSAYRPSSDALAELDVFRVSTTLDEKLTDIYSDLATNVTRIWRRNEIHLALDLAYHSVLLMRMDDRLLKGWAEILIVGDSSQGKSETALHLMRHYGLGEKVECKNASVAGLLGGIIQVSNRYFVQWGIIPTHDKRLVILEELKGASQEVIAKLTDMRSSGVAEIPKIEKRRTNARTRLVCISNPRSNRPLANYNFGVEAVVELIGGLEDLRRFDLTVLVEKGQVAAAEINRFHKDAPKIAHRYTSDLCKKLILWAWTRTPDQIVIPDETSRACIEHAIKLCEKFSESVPIIDRGSTRNKLARLACALAARTFSTVPNDRQRLLVTPDHVAYVAEFMRAQYNSTAFGYGDYSRAILLTETLREPEEIKKRVFALPYPKDFVDKMLATNEISVLDIGDWCGWDRGDAIALTSFLVRKNAIMRCKDGYHKTSAFIELLKSMRDSELMKKLDRPDFVRDADNPY